MPYYPQGPKEPPKKPPLKEQPLFRLILLCLSALLVSYGAFRLLGYGADWVTSRNTSQELREIAAATEPSSTAPPPETAVPPAVNPTPEPTPESAPVPVTAAAETAVPAEYLPAVEYPGGMNIVPRIRDLRKKSEYIMGWLTMDDLDEPVALKDNEFFLNHDATGKKNSNGAIFLDSGISLKTRPYTIILYGHNMKSGNMFGRLKKYKESTYFYKHRIITFDTMYENGQYAVFAVVEMSTTPGVARWYDLWSLTTDNYENREDAIRTLERRSVISSALDVQADDQILLLVTCLDGDTERLVVVARRIREDEGETADQLMIRTK